MFQFTLGFILPLNRVSGNPKQTGQLKSLNPYDQSLEKIALSPFFIFAISLV